jgi:hypothetical protein
VAPLRVMRERRRVTRRRCSLRCPVSVRYLDRSVPLKDGVLVQTQSPSITYGPCRSALSAMSWFQRGKLRRHVDNMFSGASVFNADLGRWNVRQSRRWPLCSTTRTRSTKALGVGIWSVGAHMPELWGGPIGTRLFPSPPAHSERRACACACASCHCAVRETPQFRSADQSLLGLRSRHSAGS